LAFTFALSRAYAEGGVDCFKKAVPKIRGATLALQEKDGGWGTDYETALGLLTLLNLGERGAPVDRAITLLVSRQMSDGGWALSTAYTGANTWMSGRYIYGSRDFTTALCIEALAKYLRQ
jgi:squalene cyclase